MKFLFNNLPNFQFQDQLHFDGSIPVIAIAE